MDMGRKLFFLIAVISLVTGCTGVRSLSPTPFPTAGPTATMPAGGPIALSVTELLNAPGLYLDATVQLTGRLRKMPLIICDSDYYPSPAGWGLGEEGLMANAGGFDDQVRSLLPGDLTMTVEGRWRRWEGMVGCGKQAQKQEVWYLDVSRILSPNPLTQITLTPSSGVEISAITAEAPAPAPDEMPEPPELQETPADTSIPTPGFEGSTEFPEVNPDAPGGYPAPGATDPTTQTPIADSTPLPGQTITATLPSDTSMPPSISTGTPGPPAGPGGLVNRGDIDNAITDNFTMSSLAAGATDSWRYEILQPDEKLYFQAIAPLPADLILSIYKDGQVVINNQNTAAAGSPEILNAPQLPGPGVYEIRIAAKGGVATEYGFTIYDDPNYPVTIGGMISPGSPRNGLQLAAGAIQFWFFTAKAGDTMGIRLKPQGEADLAADLYQPGGVYAGAIDNGYEGEEEYKEVTLTETGLHAIRVFEYYAAQSMTFDLEISLR